MFAYLGWWVVVDFVVVAFCFAVGDLVGLCGFGMLVSFVVVYWFVDCLLSICVVYNLVILFRFV